MNESSLFIHPLNMMTMLFDSPPESFNQFGHKAVQQIKGTMRSGMFSGFRGPQGSPVFAPFHAHMKSYEIKEIQRSRKLPKEVRPHSGILNHHHLQ